MSAASTRQIASLQRALARNPLDVEGWHRLRQWYVHDAPVHAWLSDLIAWLHGQPAIEPPPLRSEGALPERIRRLSLPQMLPEGLLYLLRSVGPQLSEALLSTDLLAYTESLPQSSPLARMAQRQAQLFVLPPVAVGVTELRPFSAFVVTGPQPTVVLGTALVEICDEPMLSFLLGHSLVPFSEGCFPCDLGDRGFRALLYALLELMGASCETMSIDRPLIEQLKARIAPYLPVAQRRARAALAQSTAARLQPHQVAGLRFALQRYTLRLACGLSGQFQACVKVLRHLSFEPALDPGLGPRGRVAYLNQHDLLGDLLRFAASEPCLSLLRWRAAQPK